MKNKMQSLETEKSDFLKILGEFIGTINFSDYEGNHIEGRPRFNLEDLIIALLVMSYHSWSYRRCMSDLVRMKQDGLLGSIPRRATMNKYMNKKVITKILEKLIQISALPFCDTEDTFMMDSTQFFDRILFGGSKCDSLRKKRSVKTPSLSKTRKLHITVAKRSKIICCAKTSLGTVHDHVMSRELIEIPLKNGFRMKVLLADSAYNSRENFCLCQDEGIKAFLDFKKSHRIKRSHSQLRRNQFILYHNNQEEWHEAYRFRVIVEMIFGAIKKKGRNHLRSRRPVSKDNEMLLKALWYNLCILSKTL